MGATRQRRRRICPGPAAIGGRRAKLCRPVEHRHLAVGLGGAVQGYDVGGRGRVAADHRRRRRHRIHGDGKSRGRRAGRPRHRIGRGEAVRSVGQRRRRVAPRPARVGGRGADRRRSVEQIDRAVRRCRAVSVSVVSLVMLSPVVPLSVENEAMVGTAGAPDVVTLKPAAI